MTKICRRSAHLMVVMRFPFASATSTPAPDLEPERRGTNSSPFQKRTEMRWSPPDSWCKKNSGGRPDEGCFGNASSGGPSSGRSDTGLQSSWRRPPHPEPRKSGSSCLRPSGKKTAACTVGAQTRPTASEPRSGPTHSRRRRVRRPGSGPRPQSSVCRESDV